MQWLKAIIWLWLVVTAVSAGGCAMWRGGTSAPPTSATETAQPSSADLRTAAPPVWRPGDRWIYNWSSGSAQGTKTVEIREVKELDNVRYYVVKNAEADHYWTIDLQWAASVRDSKVEARMVPPEPWYTWPLETGRRWRHRGVFEHAGGTVHTDDEFAVVGRETIAVPAGKFGALKVTRASSAGDADEYWYAPEVGSYVRWVGRRGKVEFEELLSSYQPAGSPRISPPAPQDPSSTPR